MTIKFAFLFLVCLIFSVLINRLFLKFSKNLGIRNIDDKVIRWSTTSKPSFGGISFYIVFLLVLTFSPNFFDDISISKDFKLIGIMSATTIGFLAGLTDDAYNTNPLLKSLAQAACALVLIFTGTSIQIFDWLWVNYLITFLWVVGFMNSINMLDNMDAISTIASLFALSAMLMVLFFLPSPPLVYIVLVVGLMAGLIGFLFFNWHPSRMYMGDTGSQFLGVCLAALSIHFLWNYQGFDTAPISRQVILPILAFIIPLSDTLTVVINRLSRGSSPFVGGKDHTTHHLSYIGLSDQSVALVMGGIGLISTILILIALSLETWNHLFTTLFLAYSFLVFLTLFLISRNILFKRNYAAKERSIKKTA
jgi:UDP-GlcNAc:undecaprenyl-phosphate GlcNAc-1-phosphate transferase